MLSLSHLWTRTSVLTVLLLPLALVFVLATGLRRMAYRHGWLKTYRVGVPVIVVGNITAGGSGKTPLVIWLVSWLREQGYCPGVVSRGYGGSACDCVDVQPDSLATEVGDEPLLIRIKGDCPVTVGRDRVAAAQQLLNDHPNVNLIVADDGLQHYRLQRDIELAVIDASTGLGNGWPLPAGPLREPCRRLDKVDAVVQVMRGDVAPFALKQASWRASYTAGPAYRLNQPAETRSLHDLPVADWLAVTGIGHPQGFFNMLQAHGVSFRSLAFSDHHVFRPHELPVDSAILMTEKDAVKCTAFAGPAWWAVTLDVAPEKGFVDWLKIRLKTIQSSIHAPS